MSSYNGIDLFGSGPAAFNAGPRGTQSVLKVDLGLAEPGLLFVGEHTRTVEVRGRLTAASAGALWTLIAAIEAQTGEKADLVSDDGRTWPDISLVELTCDGPPACGRVWSIGYRALFAEM